MLTLPSNKPVKRGRLLIQFTDAFVRAADGASVDLETFELVQGRRRIPLVGQGDYRREAAEELTPGFVFWAGMALSYRPVSGVLELHFDGKRFDWGHEGKKADERQSLLYDRVRARFERRASYKPYVPRWARLRAQFKALSAEERQLRGDAAQLECAFATQSQTARDDQAISGYLTAAELTYEWKAREVTVADLSKMNALVTRSRGKLRDFEACITDKNELQYVPASALHRALAELATFIEASRWTPVELAASAYQRFSSIHPFADGNGRTGRLLLNGLLHRARFPPVALRGAEQLVAIFGTRARGRNFGVERALKVVTRGMERAVRGRLVRRGHGYVLA